MRIFCFIPSEEDKAVSELSEESSVTASDEDPERDIPSATTPTQCTKGDADSPHFSDVNENCLQTRK